MQGMRAGHPIQKERPLPEVDLVGYLTRLEGISCNQYALAAQRQLAGHGDLGRPLDVAGEVWHRHAALPTFLVTASLHNLSIQQHEKAVPGSGLPMARHVDAERLRGHPDLWRGKTHATR